MDISFGHVIAHLIFLWQPMLLGRWPGVAPEKTSKWQNMCH